MSVAVKNLGEFDAQVERWLSEVAQAASEAAVGLAQEAFEQILETSPQYSGDFVANTRVSIEKPDTSFTPWPGRSSTGLYQMGSTPAMSHARAQANWPKIKLGQTIYISSTAKHDEFYSWKIESGQVKLRPVNEGGDHIYRRAVAYAQHRYTNIGPVQLDILRKIGK